MTGIFVFLLHDNFYVLISIGGHAYKSLDGPSDDSNGPFMV